MRGFFCLCFFFCSISGCAPQTHTAKQPAMSPAEPIKLLLGSYSQNGSQGLYTVEFHPDTNVFGPVTLLAAAKNPSYAVVNTPLVYTVNEIGRGKVTAYRKGEAPQAWHRLASTPTGGASPCYVSLHPEGTYLATANYMGGSVSVVKLDHQGGFVGAPVVKKHTGKGPNKGRQEAPHAHWVQWQADGRALYVVDLGIDKILRYPFSPQGQLGQGTTALQLSPGDGPRHMVFHPKLSVAFILNELSNSLVVADIQTNGLMQERMRLNTLPDDFINHSQAAHIAINKAGTRVYISNRGHDSIAVYAVDDTGALRFLAWEATKGVWPRHFILLEDAKKLIVANQQHNNIVVFDIDDKGLLVETDAELAQPEVTYIGRL